MRKLSEMRAGTTVTVVSVEPGPGGSRLAAIGFVPGTVVEVGHTAPLGDPRRYRLRGAEFALRRDAASLVSVDEGGAS
jgi:ferrous iron transport protein A